MESTTEILGEDPAKWPDVAIIVLNWNNYEDTSRCLKSLSTVEYPNLQIYVVDNGSTDGSGDRLAKEFDWCNFVFNDENLGFAAGCNQGIREAMDSDYILLLNNDTIVPCPNFLTKGVKVAESDEKYGIVGGKILYWPDTDQIWSTGGSISYFSECYIGHGEYDHGQYDSLAEREFISGALMLVSSDVINEIGLLPEVYFFGREDWEYSKKAMEEGYKLMYSPNFVVYHEAGNSQDHSDSTFVYNSVLSKVLYKRRNLSRPKYLFWVYLYFLYIYLALPIRYRFDTSGFNQNIPKNKLFKAMRHAARDALNTRKITENTLQNYREQVNK